MSQTRKEENLQYSKDFQNTVGVLQHLIGKVPCITSKEKTSLLVFKKRNTSASFWMEYHIQIFCINGSTRSTRPQHKCHHMAVSYINSDLPRHQKAEVCKNLQEKNCPDCMTWAELSFNCI